MKWLVLISIVLIGCDPAKRITVKNKSEGQATFTLKMNAADTPDFEKTQNHTIVLPDVNGRNSHVFYLGLGGWSDRGIKDISESAEYIRITTAKDTLMTTSRYDIQQYFLNCRTGLFQSNIRIIIK